MKIKNSLALLLVGVLIFMQVGSAYAQEDETTEEAEETCTNPIAGLFEAYYNADTGEGQAAGVVDEITETSITVGGVSYLINEETVGAEGVAAGDEVTVDYFTDENEDLVATNVALGIEEGEEETSVCDEVTAYHEDGMGWGVLVKLYAMAAESLEACDGVEDCGVSVEELVEMFNSGTGMGQLFHEFGKPAQLGVGHLRKAVKNCETAGDDDTETADAGTTADDGNGNGKGKGKGKGNNGNGGGDDDGDGTSSTQGNGKGKGKGGKGGKGGNGNGADNGQGNAGGNDGNTTEPTDGDDDEGEPDEDDGEPDEDDGEPDEDDGEPDEVESSEGDTEEDDCADGDDTDSDNGETATSAQSAGNGKGKGKGKKGK